MCWRSGVFPSSAGICLQKSIQLFLILNPEHVDDILLNIIRQQYVGMNREQFVEAMKLYEASPPLAEMSRGFEGILIFRHIIKPFILFSRIKKM